MRTFTVLLLTLLAGLLLTPKTRAQSEGTLLKTSLGSTRISSVATLPNGLMVGEFDGRVWNNPYNGLFFTRDLGQTWEQTGLDGRGITDIEYHQGMLYVTTYYTLNQSNGLFISSDLGNNLTQTGPSISTSNVEVTEETIYLGSYSHGLWISVDAGQTWEQKIGDGSGWFGPNITSMKAQDNLAFASTPTMVYKSIDNGDSWEEIPALEGAQIGYYHINDHVVLAGSNNNSGLFRSEDFGESWSRVDSWGEYPTGSITSFKNIYYAQKINRSNQQFIIYYSSDNGLTWEESEIGPSEKVVDITTLFSHPSFFFMVINFDGLYYYGIPTNNTIKIPLLEIPWDYSSTNELIDKISAYFDHQFPLGNYSYKSEPAPYSNTTLNFFGQNEKTPLMFYSSHNGIDFSLPLGTQVIAPAVGYARYYTCTDCGHSIKIDHTNGFETTYMHLQEEGLISSNPDDQLWVEKGEVLGLVGMSGKTSGPHLHFNVLYDKNHNGLFDDFPDGLTDPFGWQDPYNKDPWVGLSWIDALGSHSGTESVYLWQSSIDNMSQYITQDSPVIHLDNKTITFNSQDLEKNTFTALAYNFVKPQIPFSQFELAYIENTSFSLTLMDHYEEEIISMDENITISIDLTDLNLKDIIKDTLKIYFWNDFIQQWEPLPTIFDQINNRLTAETDHLSHYVVMGEKFYSAPPMSAIEISGNIEDGWYTVQPTIQFSTEDFSGLGIKNIYYSLNKGRDWDTYQTPLVLEQDGVVEVLYRAEDMAGNLESTHSQVIRIDTQNRWKSAIKVTGNIFSTQ